RWRFFCALAGLAALAARPAGEAPLCTALRESFRIFLRKIVIADSPRTVGLARTSCRRKFVFWLSLLQDAPQRLSNKTEDFTLRHTLSAISSVCVARYWITSSVSRRFFPGVPDVRVDFDSEHGIF